MDFLLCSSDGLEVKFFGFDFDFRISDFAENNAQEDPAFPLGPSHGGRRVRPEKRWSNNFKLSLTVVLSINETNVMINLTAEQLYSS